MKTKFEADTGHAANATFGAYVMSQYPAGLLIGMGNDPGNSDGADLVRYINATTLLTEYTPDEQGVADIQSMGYTYVPGVDPDEDWTFGNLYVRDVDSGAWVKYRTMPNVIHAFGLHKYIDLSLYVATGSHTGDMATWVGQVLTSTDRGATWDSIANVNNYRIFDVMRLLGKWYASGQNLAGDDELYIKSSGVWSVVAGIRPRHKARLILYNNMVVMASYYQTFMYTGNSAGVVTTYNLPFSIGVHYNVLVVGKSYLYALANNGDIWRTTNFSAWTLHSHVDNAITIALHPDGEHIVVSDNGLNARIWSVPI